MISIIRRAVVTLSFLSFLSACRTPFSFERIVEGDWKCQFPPSDFSEDHLIGRWYHQGASVNSEELIIRDDGHYQQIFEVSDGSTYESSWNSWWIEHRVSGGLYLHLNAMRYTGSTDYMRNLPEGGTGKAMQFDLCEQRIIRLDGEVVLVVFGTGGSTNPFLASAPRGISLMNMSDDGDSGTTHFILKSHSEDE